MYTCEITCKKCSHMIYYQESELWSIISLANDLESDIVNDGEGCVICGELGPIHMAVKNHLDLLVFEKILAYIPNCGITPNNAYQKSTMDNPCFPCCATGKLEIQYKAHKKDSFKGVLTEDWPICDGKGYFN